MVKHFKLPRKLVDRENYLLSYCRDKRVLHLGCADFASEGDWERKLQSGQWLHKRIAETAQLVVGVDNSERAVAILRERYGYKDIVCGSAEQLDALNPHRFDVILAGELLEHLPSPGSLLSAAARGMSPDASLIVTTTNAFCVRRMLRVACGSESIHVDHVAYYSHRTLARLAQLCGLRVVDQASYQLPNKRPILPYLVERCAATLSPNLCEGVIGVFSTANGV
jgi:2-polyprenyl-3-methyl-5-hydroxy-6-metoxy-1,4-benzoquinol methylase